MAVIKALFRRPVCVMDYCKFIHYPAGTVPKNGVLSDMMTSKYCSTFYAYWHHDLKIAFLGISILGPLLYFSVVPFCCGHPVMCISQVVYVFQALVPLLQPLMTGLPLTLGTGLLPALLLTPVHPQLEETNGEAVLLKTGAKQLTLNTQHMDTRTLDNCWCNVCIMKK